MSTAKKRIPISLNSAPAPPSEAGLSSIAVLGDLMLSGEWDSASRRDQAEELFSPLREVCRGCLVLANLETAMQGDEGVIRKQPTLVAPRRTLDACLRSIGADVVILSNNHAFDSYLSGFERLRELLGERNILWLGAGRDSAEAARPLVLEQGDLRFGYLAYTDPSTKPSHIAHSRSFGVNLLIEETVVEDILRLKRQADHVVVSLHWGIEYCHLPSPRQIQFARRLIDLGTSLVVGHHAHVIQGVEWYESGAIAFNLGNAATTDLRIDGRLAIRQTRRTRSSAVLRATFSKNRVESLDLVPFRNDGTAFLVRDALATRILERANRRLQAGITSEQWRLTRLYEDVVIRTLRKLDPRVIRSVRSRHIFEFFKHISSFLRGSTPD